MKPAPSTHIIHGVRHSFSYILERKAVKNINLRIRPDGGIYVSAPAWIPQADIDRFLLSKENFILKARTRIQQARENQAPAFQGMPGETFYYLGKPIQLQIKQGENASFQLRPPYLVLTLPNSKQSEAVRQLFQEFWLEQCEKIFCQQAKKIYPPFQKAGIAFPQIHIKTMRSRWGSCMPQKGIITLNTHLLKYSRRCIHYVILHEFCHFIHPNHSRDFYRLVEALMPEWKQAREELKQMH